MEHLQIKLLLGSHGLRAHTRSKSAMRPLHTATNMQTERPKSRYIGLQRFNVLSLNHLSSLCIYAMQQKTCVAQRITCLGKNSSRAHNSWRCCIEIALQVEVGQQLRTYTNNDIAFASTCC